MPKRFTDTAIWDKKWFMDLTPAEKSAWSYIKDRCDTVGVWEPNFRLAEFYIGAEIDWDAFAKKCNGNIVILQNGKWWLCDFCTFQYGYLSEESKGPPMKSYIALLKKHGLWEDYLKRINALDIPLEKGIDTLGKEYVKSSDTPKDKDKDKDIDKDKDYIPSDIYIKERKKEINKEREKDCTNNADSDELLHTETTLNGVIVYTNPSQDNSCSVSAYTNPQSIVKESIENNKREEEEKSAEERGNQTASQTAQEVPLFDEPISDKSLTVVETNIAVKQQTAPPGNKTSRQVANSHTPEDIALYNKIKTTFEAVHGDFANYAKEGASIHKIIKLAKGDEATVGLMLSTFHELTQGTNHFWSSQPYVPSRLLALWDSVKVEAQKQIEVNDVSWLEGT